MSRPQKQSAVGGLLQHLSGGRRHSIGSNAPPDADPSGEAPTKVLESLLQLERGELVSFASDPASNWFRVDCVLLSNGELRCTSEGKELSLVYDVCYASHVTRRDEIRYDRYRVFKLFTTEGTLFLSCSTQSVAKRWITAVRNLCAAGKEKALDSVLDKLDPHYHHQLTLEAMASSTLLAKLNNGRAPKAILPRTKLSQSMEGWLYRYCQRQWTREYFILEDNLLFRFVHKSQLFIPVEVISVHESHTCVIAPKEDNPGVFQILTPRLQLTLKSTYKGAMMAWLAHLSSPIYDRVIRDMRIREGQLDLCKLEDVLQHDDVNQAFEWFLQRSHKQALRHYDFAKQAQHLLSVEDEQALETDGWKLIEDFVEDSGEHSIQSLASIHEQVEPLATKGKWSECFEECLGAIESDIADIVGEFKESIEFKAVLPNYAERVVYGPKVLVVQQEGEEDVVVSLSPGKVSIGRSENADVTINNRTLSRLHCIVHVTDDDYVIAIDNNSSSGISVNGARVAQYYMGWDDEVRLNQTTVIQLTQQWN